MSSRCSVVVHDSQTVHVGCTLPLPQHDSMQAIIAHPIGCQIAHPGHLVYGSLSIGLMSQCSRRI